MINSHRVFFSSSFFLPFDIIGHRAASHLNPDRRLKKKRGVWKRLSCEVNGVQVLSCSTAPGSPPASCLNAHNSQSYLHPQNVPRRSMRADFFFVPPSNQLCKSTEAFFAWKLNIQTNVSCTFHPPNNRNRGFI